MEELSFSSDARASLEFLTQRPKRTVDTLLGEAKTSDIEEWTAHLEMSMFLIAGLEAVAELEIKDTAGLFARSEELFAATARLMHLTVPQMTTRISAHQQRLAIPPSALPVTSFEPSRSLLIAPVRSLLALCPIRQLEQQASQLGVESLGHRCRVAFDWLQSFLRRADPAIDRQTQVIAIAYAEGRLRLGEVAALLHMTTRDAVAWLDDYGHCRAIGALAMSAGERNHAFAALRADRLDRVDRPALDESLVRRDVAATQRIEGIDARPWLPER